MIGITLIWSLLISAVAAVLVFLFYYVGKEDGEKRNKTPTVFMCLSFLGFFIVVFFMLCLGVNRDASRKEVLRRLNQPIVSYQQLYGYKIVGKKLRQNKSETLEDSSSSTTYLISVEDLLDPLPGNKHILLKNVEVSEEFFQGVEVGECFPPESNADPNNQ